MGARTYAKESLLYGKRRPSVPQASWQTKQVYAMAAVCLVVGLAVGYLFRGSAATQVQNPAQAVHGGPNQMPTLDQMKHMADKQAEPLLAQLKTTPE